MFDCSKWFRYAINNYNIIVINTSDNVVIRIKSTFNVILWELIRSHCSHVIRVLILSGLCCGVLVFDHQNCILCAYITVSFLARKPPHHTHRFIEQSIRFFVFY